MKFVSSKISKNPIMTQMHISIGYYKSLNGVVKIIEKKASNIFPNPKGALSMWSSAMV